MRRTLCQLPAPHNLARVHIYTTETHLVHCTEKGSNMYLTARQMPISLQPHGYSNQLCGLACKNATLLQPRRAIPMRDLLWIWPVTFLSSSGLSGYPKLIPSICTIWSFFNTPTESKITCGLVWMPSASSVYRRLYTLAHRSESY